MSNEQVILTLLTVSIFVVVMLVILHFQNKKSMTPEKAQAQARDLAQQAWKIYEIKISDAGLLVYIRLADDPARRWEELLFSFNHPDCASLRNQTALAKIFFQYFDQACGGGDLHNCTSYLRIA